MDDLRARLAAARPGERWVVRHRLPDGRATDVVGWLLTTGPAAVSLEVSASAEVVRVAVDTVVAARRAPAAAGGRDPGRTSPAELERTALPGWLAWSEPLGEWTLRAGGGFTGRANSCLAVGDPGVAPEAAAAAIVAHARRHQIPPRAQVVVGSREEADLRELGWEPASGDTAVLACRLGDLLGGTLPDPAVEVSQTLDDRWCRAFARSRPNDADPALLRMILDGRPPRAFAGLPEPGSHADPHPDLHPGPGPARDPELVAIARGHLHQGWLGLASIWVSPEQRRRGRATAVVVALGHWAARRDARWAYLQVAGGNVEAIAAYARLGFGPHHRYHYLAPG